MSPVVRASGIRGYSAVMRELACDPKPLLRRHRIAAQVLEDEDALVDVRAFMYLLEASSEATGCSDLGLRIAQKQDIGILGPLGIVIQNAATAFEALTLASRYLFTHSPGLVLTANLKSPSIEDAIELVFEIHLPGQPIQRQNIDLCLGSTHRIARTLVGSHYDLKLVTLPHAPIVPLSTYRRFFGAPVVANQARAALHLASSGLRGKLQGANPAMKRITEDYLARNFRMQADSVSARVRLALKRMLGTSKANKQDIAAMLAMHPRTLHRRLEAEGTGFEAIRESLRQELALQYLRESKVPLGQISALLGFPEQSAFTRSARRWFGKTPSEIRNRG